MGTEFPPELRLPVELPEVSLPAVPAEVTSAIDTVSSSIEIAKTSAADTRKNLPELWNTGVQATFSGIIYALDSPDTYIKAAQDKFAELTDTVAGAVSDK